jgi:lipopolysaccharide/colanic/teichoic acid biosynthesis glycosyltransferase
MPHESELAMRDRLPPPEAVPIRPHPSPRIARFPRPTPEVDWYRSCKRVADRGAALVLLVLGSPVILLACALVKLTSRGPAFYSQTRVGLNGRPFMIYKIRSMYHNCERLTGPRWAARGDRRVTPVGRVLRRLHLDELPQLWNVVRGEMCLVGPRPERPEFLPQLEQALPRYRDRLAVPPGLTGLAQVLLPADSDLSSVRRKLAYDLYYVQRLGPWLDLRVVLATVLYLAGLPRHLVRKVLRIPPGDVIERAYQRRAEEAAPVRRRQSV